MTRSDLVWRDANLAATYLEGVRGAVPLAAEQIDVLLRVLRHGTPSVERVLDLGCGDGILGHAVMDAFPGAAGVFLDVNDTMIAAARQRLTDHGDKASFLMCDYGDLSWRTHVQAQAPFCAVVSGFSIHHQPDDRKKELYEEILSLLRPGGVFLNLEHVSSPAPWIEKAFEGRFIESLFAHHQTAGTGKTRDDVARAFYHRDDKAANILAPVEDQCAWLRQAGFEDVDCFFKHFELALFGGRRPA